MKILFISSSPRKTKSQTFILGRGLLKGCAVGKEKSQTLNLCDLKIDFCHHCEECHKDIMACPIKDDVRMILEKMLEADGIILASPNYINHVTASMKALFDRSTHFIHCKRLLGKYVVGCTCSGSGQNADVLNYIKYFAFTCGAQYSGGVSSQAPVSKDKIEEAHKLGQQFVLDIKEKKVFDGQLEIINKGKEYFTRIIKMRELDWVGEYLYWQQNNWL